MRTYDDIAGMIPARRLLFFRDNPGAEAAFGRGEGWPPEGHVPRVTPKRPETAETQAAKQEASAHAKAEGEASIKAQAEAAAKEAKEAEAAEKSRD